MEQERVALMASLAAAEAGVHLGLGGRRAVPALLRAALPIGKRPASSAPGDPGG